MRGLRKYLTPFAPDQSGAVSVLYELGGIVVICDAGGCTGNICGFDEPRWDCRRSAVFSAGLREMDAILGRDDKLVAELADAARRIDASFAAIVGTPVPSVIGTDYRALARMVQSKTGLRVLTVDTTGMELYDVGAEKAYLALFSRFAADRLPVVPGRIGVLGANPLDLGDLSWAKTLLSRLPGAVCYGMDSGLEAVAAASSAEKNLVVAPSGLKAARDLQARFGTPYACWDPLAEDLLPDLDFAGKRILVIHQQITANTLREHLLERGAETVHTATWFMQLPELTRAGDTRLQEEDDLKDLVRAGGYDLILGDQAQWPILAGYAGELADLPQFSVSGRMGATDHG